jgi:hypothetical protein
VTLRIIPIELKPRTEAERHHLRAANGVNLDAEHATHKAIVAALALMLVMVVVLLFR